MPAPRDYFFNLLLHYDDYNIAFCEGLLPANLCLVTLISLEQCSQFERFRLQHIQVINKTCTFKTKLIGNNPEASKVNHSTF